VDACVEYVDACVEYVDARELNMWMHVLNVWMHVISKGTHRGEPIRTYGQHVEDVLHGGALLLGAVAELFELHAVCRMGQRERHRLARPCR
jgi:hypothetical protein